VGSDPARAPLLDRIRRTLQERALLRGATHVLVACSGGPDSQVLLHALHALRAEHRCRLMAASVDHGLRPDATADVAVAARLAARLGLPFVALKVTLAPGASRQAAAREARYAALSACAAAHQAERIAVGHTRDDQAETVLARLLRGAGIEGLAAIAPRRADGVVRPLIDCPRTEVHGYAESTPLEVAHDPSNLDPAYLRVRVRKTLLPSLCEENPKLPEQLAHLADDAREAAALLRELAVTALTQAAQKAARLREEPPLVRRLALKILVEREAGAPLTRAHVAALDRMLWVGGQVRVPGDTVVSVDRGGELSCERVAKRGRGVRRPIDPPDTK
jgi:tRNA(Ile)-lysidine synthase